MSSPQFGVPVCLANDLHALARAGNVKQFLAALQFTDPLDPDDKGKTPLDYARLYGHQPIVEVIIYHCDAAESLEGPTGAPAQHEWLPSQAPGAISRAKRSRHRARDRSSRGSSSFRSGIRVSHRSGRPAAPSAALDSITSRLGASLKALSSKYAKQQHSQPSKSEGFGHSSPTYETKVIHPVGVRGIMPSASRSAYSAADADIMNSYTQRMLSGTIPDPHGVELEQLRRAERRKGRHMRTDNAEIALESFLQKHKLKGGKRFTRQEKLALRSFFDFLDDDGSGAVDGEELEDPLFSTGVVRNHRELQDVLNSVDLDGNGELDFQELLEALLPGAGGFSSDTFAAQVEGTGVVAAQVAAAGGMGDGRKRVKKGTIPHDEGAMSRVRRLRLLARQRSSGNDKSASKGKRRHGQPGKNRGALLGSRPGTSSTGPIDSDAADAGRYAVEFEQPHHDASHDQYDQDQELERPRRGYLRALAQRSRERISLRLKASSSVASRVGTSSQRHLDRVQEEAAQEAERIHRAGRAQLSELYAPRVDGDASGVGFTGTKGRVRKRRTSLSGTVAGPSGASTAQSPQSAKLRFEETVRRGRMLDKQRKLVMERRTLRRKARARLQLAQYLAGRSEAGASMEPGDIHGACVSFGKGLFEVPVPGMPTPLPGERRTGTGASGSSTGRGLGVSAHSNRGMSPAGAGGQGWDDGGAAGSDAGSMQPTVAHSKAETIGLASRLGRVGAGGTPIGWDPEDGGGEDGGSENSDVFAARLGGGVSQHAVKARRASIARWQNMRGVHSGGEDREGGADRGMDSTPDVPGLDSASSLARLRESIYGKYETHIVEGAETGATLSTEHKMELLRAMPRPKGADVPHYRIGTVGQQVQSSLAELARVGDAMKEARRAAIVGHRQGGASKLEPSDGTGKQQPMGHFASSSNISMLERYSGRGMAAAAAAPSASSGRTQTPILDRWNAAKVAKSKGRGGNKPRMGNKNKKGGNRAHAMPTGRAAGDDMTHDGALSVAMPTHEVLRNEVGAGQVQGGVALKKLIDVLLADNVGDDAWKDRLELPSRLVMHRRHFLISTVLNARRIEAVISHLVELGIEEAREAGDAEALSRLSVVKNRQYERQLERSERLSALRSILTRSLQERRQDRAEKEKKEAVAMERAAREMGVMHGKQGAEDGDRSAAAASAAAAAAATAGAAAIPHGGGEAQMHGSAVPSNASSRRSSVDGQPVQHSKNRILDPGDRPASALSTLFDPREFATEEERPASHSSHARRGRSRVMDPDADGDSDDSMDRAQARRRAAVSRFQSAVRTVMLTISAERSLKARAQGRARQFVREIMRLASRSNGKEGEDGSELMERSLAAGGVSQGRGGKGGPVDGRARKQAEQERRARAEAKYLVESAVRAGQRAAGGSGAARGTGQSNSRHLELLPGFQDSTQPRLNEAMAAAALRSEIGVSIKHPQDDPGTGSIRTTDFDSKRRSKQGSFTGIRGASYLTTIALGAHERRGADALNAADGVSGVAARTRLGAAGASVVGKAAKSAAPGVVYTVGSLGGLVDAMREGGKLLKRAGRQRARASAHPRAPPDFEAEGGSPRGMQFDIGSTEDYKVKLARVRAGAAEDAAGVLAKVSRS